MSGASLIGAVFAFLAGSLVAMQAPINAMLARAMGSTALAATVSFMAGLIVLGVISAATVRHIDPAWRDAPLWLFFAGGCLGAMFVASIIVLTPQLGAARMLALVVAGQLATGLVIDHFGWFGLAVQEISVGRIAGALAVIAGAVLLSSS